MVALRACRYDIFADTPILVIADIYTYHYVYKGKLVSISVGLCPSVAVYQLLRANNGMPDPLGIPCNLACVFHSIWGPKVPHINVYGIIFWSSKYG